MLQSLLHEQVEGFIATALTPTARLVLTLALAAVHAARVAALVLDDVDLGNCRSPLAERARPLDELTLKLPDGLARPPADQQPALDKRSDARAGRHLGAASR
ncbi:hypothetical protein AB0I84_46425 [Streptomyces spectabilis]|uniref:hypothetical protein n=1 Tax=Streptomyces spectabilis TaxID=68270 RepID=UPI0033CCEC88